MNRSDHLSILNDELARRKKRNARYSLRAFSQSLGVDAGLLSKLMSGKRPMSLATAKQIVNKIGLNPVETQLFLNSLLQERSKEKLQSVGVVSSYAPREIEIDTFQFVADIYHYAILELTYTEGFKSDVGWIAAQLGISKKESREAIDRMIRLGLLKLENGKYVKTNSNITTANKDQTNTALKRHQQQALEAAIMSLNQDPIEERNMTSMTLAIDPRRIPEAKKRISEMMESLADLLEVGRPRRVYEMTVNLFPIQKKDRL